jgi:DNA-directed RNA polymerase subunit beta'
MVRARGADPKWRHVIVFEGEHVEKGETVVTASRIRTTSCACSGVSRWPATWSRKSGRVPPAGRAHQRQAHRDDHSPDAAQDRVTAWRHALPAWRAGRSDAHAEENRRAKPQRMPARLIRSARHHQGLAGDRVVHFGASFQETTRVLTEAAVRGTRDTLRGSRKMLSWAADSAGTGLAYHSTRAARPQALIRLGHRNPAGGVTEFVADSADDNGWQFGALRQRSAQPTSKRGQGAPRVRGKEANRGASLTPLFIAC